MLPTAEKQSKDGGLKAALGKVGEIVFMERRRCVGTMPVWAEPFVPLRVPRLFNLRTNDQAMENLEAGLSGAGH